jgi:hypothetical protein
LWNSELAKFDLPLTLPEAMVVILGSAFQIHAARRELKPH